MLACRTQWTFGAAAVGLNFGPCGRAALAGPGRAGPSTSGPAPGSLADPPAGPFVAGPGQNSNVVLALAHIAVAVLDLTFHHEDILAPKCQLCLFLLRDAFLIVQLGPQHGEGFWAPLGTLCSYRQR